MCSRHSMRCVYCMWQLMFIDIINNNELSIMYCDWLCSPYTCLLCWTLDGTYDLIIHWTLALNDFIQLIYRLWHLTLPHSFRVIRYHIVYSYAVCHSVLHAWPFHYYIVFHHIICTCTFLFIFTRSLGVLTLWIYTSRSMYVILLIRVLC